MALDRRDPEVVGKDLDMAGSVRSGFRHDRKVDPSGIGEGRLLPRGVTVILSVQAAKRPPSSATQLMSVATTARIWLVSGRNHTGVEPVSHVAAVSLVPVEMGA